MNRKKLRIVSLLIAAIMMMSLSGMAFAYEEEDVVVDPIGMPALPPECGVECADHSHDSDGLVGIEPANILCIFGHKWVFWACFIDSSTFHFVVIGTDLICGANTWGKLEEDYCERCNIVGNRRVCGHRNSYFIYDHSFSGNRCTRCGYTRKIL